MLGRRGTADREHRAGEDPFVDIGLKDLTAHVNFSDLIAAGTATGLQEAGFRSQREFLIDLGLLGLMEHLAVAADPASIRRLQALKTLLRPQMMGDCFRVLLQRKGGVSPRLWDSDRHGSTNAFEARRRGGGSLAAHGHVSREAQFPCLSSLSPATM